MDSTDEDGGYYNKKILVNFLSSAMKERQMLWFETERRWKDDDYDDDDDDDDDNDHVDNEDDMKLITMIVNQYESAKRI